VQNRSQKVVNRGDSHQNFGKNSTDLQYLISQIGGLSQPKPLGANVWFYHPKHGLHLLSINVKISERIWNCIQLWREHPSTNIPGCFHLERRKLKDGKPVSTICFQSTSHSSLLHLSIKHKRVSKHFTNIGHFWAGPTRH